MLDAVIVFGYNNIRIYDVRTIKERAKQLLNAITILCKKNPTDVDRATVDYVIDTDLEPTFENVTKVLNGIADLPVEVKVVALLPFSDPGTQLASVLSSKIKGLRAPNPHKIKAALDKFAFREAERLSTVVPHNYKKVGSWQLSSYDDLNALYEAHQGRIFLKPAKEGGSNGCINLSVRKDIESAWSEVEKYASGGLVAEELISGGDEYSWDHVNGYSWITEKKTSDNGYNTEFQHIVPALLGRDIEEMISNAGKFMAELSGYNRGACHNEIFYFPSFRCVKGVEPNLRPAGGRIWDLAALAFENFDPWGNWILWAAGKTTEEPKKLKQKYYAGMRKIVSPANGLIAEIMPYNVQDYSGADFELVEIFWIKKVGDFVFDSPKNNSEYLGFVIGRSKKYESLAIGLKTVATSMRKKVVIKSEGQL